jgi:hypothetical protein
MHITPETRAWLLTIDPLRDPHGIIKRQLEALVEKLEREPEPRTAGGPGSGNFGHAGRPGAVGGSAPQGRAPGGAAPGAPGPSLTADHIDAPSATRMPVAEPRMPHGHIDAPASGLSMVEKATPRGGVLSVSEVHAQLHARGIQTASYNETHEASRMGIALQLRDPRDAREVPTAIAEGTQAALERLKRDAPAHYEQYLKNVKICFTENDTDGISGTTMYHPSGKLEKTVVLMNASASHAQIMRDISEGRSIHKSDYSVAMKMASEQGLKGDAFLKFVTEATLVHELGHIVDRQTNMSLTRSLVDKLGESMHQAEMPMFVKRNLSPYAADGGAGEAAAELFSAFIEGAPVVDALNGLRSVYLGK